MLAAGTIDYALKKRITIPRMGFVTFRTVRKIKITKAALVMFITGAFTLLVILVTIQSNGISAWIGQHIIFLIGLVVAIPPLIGAFLIRIKRFYIWTMLIAAVFFVEHFIPGSFPYNSTFFGFVLLTSGTIVLIRFLQKYLKPSKEVTYEK